MWISDLKTRHPIVVSNISLSGLFILIRNLVDLY